jgi:D-alanyl-D-alanine carboxypeptidase/D-alanyl-D-alanine-endopeptidase (penicillin-binding protein 4)
LYGLSVRRFSRALAVAGALAAGTLAGPATQVAAADAPSVLRAALQRAMAAAGGRSGAYIYDESAQRPLFTVRADVARPPASVEKLYTSITALQRLGPDARLTTTVLGVGSKDEQGVWHGDLYLRGGGDPTFGSTNFIRQAYGSGDGASVSQLARQLVLMGITGVEGRVIGDESAFDPFRGGPRTGLRRDGDLEGVLSALAFNRGQSGTLHGPHAPAAYAAKALSNALKSAGVPVTGASTAGVTPASSTLLAAVPSPPLSTLLGLMLPPSDNFIAEMLDKYLGARFGGGGTTAAGAAVVRQTVTGLGIHAAVVDGSGLSAADRTSPHQVVTLLTDIFGQPNGVLLRSSLPVAGVSGTLRNRMRRTTAARHCQAKTGTLNGVSNLAGYCDAAGGHTIAFAVMMDGISDAAAHRLQDSIAITLSRYDDGTGPIAPAPAPAAPLGARGATGSPRP